MFKAVITEKSGKQSTDVRKTREELQQWIDKEVANNSWGKPDRWIREKEISDQEKAISTNQRKIVEREANGDDPEVSFIEYFIPADYEIVGPLDITSEVQAENAAKISRKAKRDKRKDDFDKIDWDKVDTIAKMKKVLIDIVDELEELRKLID